MLLMDNIAPKEEHWRAPLEQPLQAPLRAANCQFLTLRTPSPLGLPCKCRRRRYHAEPPGGNLYGLLKSEDRGSDPSYGLATVILQRRVLSVSRSEPQINLASEVQSISS